MIQAGHWCIDTFQRGVMNYPEATQRCHDERRSVCPVEALMVCDMVNLAPNQPAGCGVTTDVPSARLWTSSFEAAFDTRVFQGIAVYGGDEIIRQGNAGDFHPYYCCKPTGAP